MAWLDKPRLHNGFLNLMQVSWTPMWKKRSALFILLTKGRDFIPQDPNPLSWIFDFVEKCYKCNRYGHFARECKVDVDRCYKCSELGHIAKDCPKEIDSGMYQTLIIKTAACVIIKFFFFVCLPENSLFFLCILKSLQMLPV